MDVRTLRSLSRIVPLPGPTDLNTMSQTFAVGTLFLCGVDLAILVDWWGSLYWCLLVCSLAILGGVGDGLGHKGWGIWGQGLDNWEVYIIGFGAFK